MDPRLNYYRSRGEEPITTPSVRSRAHKDLYMNLLAFEQDGSSATVTRHRRAARRLDLDRQLRHRVRCALQHGRPPAPPPHAVRRPRVQPSSRRHDELAQIAIGSAIALPIIALLAYGMTLDPSELPSTLPGKPAPEFALPMMDEPPDTVRLSRPARRRGRAELLGVVVSGVPRRALRPVPRREHVRGPKGVRSTACCTATRVERRAWIREMGGQAYPALVDDGSRTAISYGLYGVPETFIIDQQGTVVHKQIGPITAEKLASIIDPLLAEPAATLDTAEPAGTAPDETAAGAES
jgi:cytochrome c biogenesis protein CcmG, thiol:disulfide interchange protein DsbE